MKRSSCFELCIAALTVVAAAAQNPFLNNVEADDCGKLNVTMTVRDLPVVLQNGNLFVKEDSKATQWTLEQAPNNKDAWRIYHTHPSGKKFFWNSWDGYEIININEYEYSVNDITILRAESSGESTEDEGEGDGGEHNMAIFWQDHCLLYEGEAKPLKMAKYTDCELVKISEAKPTEWEKTTDPCKILE